MGEVAGLWEFAADVRNEGKLGVAAAAGAICAT